MVVPSAGRSTSPQCVAPLPSGFPLMPSGPFRAVLTARNGRNGTRETTRGRGDCCFFARVTQGMEALRHEGRGFEGGAMEGDDRGTCIVPANIDFFLQPACQQCFYAGTRLQASSFRRAAAYLQAACQTCTHVWQRLASGVMPTCDGGRGRFPEKPSENAVCSIFFFPTSRYLAPIERITGVDSVGNS